MTAPDLLAYDVDAVLAGTLALSELSPDEAAAVTAAIDERIRQEAATDTWLYELLYEREQTELRRQGPCDSYQVPEDRAAGAGECATCGLPPESHRGDAQ